MRIAVVNLTRGGFSGGYKKYLETVLPLLVAHPRVTDLSLLSPPGFAFQPSTNGPHWHWPAADPLRRFPALRAHLRLTQPDVVFIPTARFLQSGLPTVVMVRNMEPLVAPFAGNSLRDGLVNLARRAAARISAVRADGVIAVSSFVRDYLAERWHIDPTKIAVIPHGVSSALGEHDRAVPPALAARPGAMLFTAGSIRPARGLEDAISALALMRDTGRDAYLVIAGSVAGSAAGYQRELVESIDRRGLADHVVWLGSVSPREMAWCFANCSAFVMTSRVEACPNTALEALSYGAACIATTNRPMPETFGEAACYYVAGNAADLAERVSMVVALNAHRRASMARLAVARSREFTWDATVRDTVHALERAAEGA